MEGSQSAKSGTWHWLSSLFSTNSRSESSPSSGGTSDETTYLLPKPTDQQQDTDEVYDDEVYARTRTQRIALEFWILFKSSIPVILAYTLQNSLQTVSVLIVGRLSPESLAVAAFSYMFAMASAWLIGMGGTTAIDTLASASFTGSKNKHDLGIILQRAFVVLTTFYVPVAVLWLCSEPVFKALGQEDYIARDSAKFLTVLIPGGLGYIYFECMKKYLQAFVLPSRNVRRELT